MTSSTQHVVRAWTPLRKTNSYILKKVCVTYGSFRKGAINSIFSIKLLSLPYITGFWG